MRILIRAILACGMFGAAFPSVATEPSETISASPSQEARMDSRWDEDMQRLSKLSKTSSQTGNHGPLIAESAKLLAQIEQQSGERSVDFATMLNAHAMFLDAAGQPAEAKPLLARSLQLSNDLLGDRHRLTIRNLHNYAFVMVRLGDLQNAVPYYDLALRLRTDVLGEADSQTLLTRINYAHLLLRLGRPEKAAPLFAESLRISQQNLGARHSITQNSRKGYAETLRKLGRKDEAKAVLSGQI